MPGTDIQTKAPAEDPSPGIVILPYRDPLERALGALGKQATVAFVTAILLGCADILARATTGEFLDGRALGIALTTVVVHAALVGLRKYSDAAASDGRGA